MQTQLLYQDVLLSVRLSHKHEFERGFEVKTGQVYFVYPFPCRLKLEKSLQTCYVDFFLLTF